jgi:hypothetical protein
MGVEMILYTERQLKVAYQKYLGRLMHANVQGVEVPFPTLEDFRKIYEDEWTNKYKEMDNGL